MDGNNEFPAVDDFSDDINDYSSDDEFLVSDINTGETRLTSLQTDQSSLSRGDSRVKRKSFVGVDNRESGDLSDQSSCNWSTVDSQASLIKTGANINVDSS